MKVPFKIRVPTREDSKQVQQYIFSQNGSWSTREKVVQCCEKEFLYVNSDKRISHGYDDAYFRQHSFPEITIDELLNPESKKTSPPITSSASISDKFEKGDYIIALVDSPSGGSISKGEVGIITKATHIGTSTSCIINFESYINYLHTVHYSKELKIARITKEEYESKRGIIKESEGYKRMSQVRERYGRISKNVYEELYEDLPLLFLDDALTKPKSNTSITQGVVSLPPKTKRKPTIEIISTEGVKI